ncbi:MAG: DUF1549 domain-containing protein [Bryobacteraceae bacterium]
MTVGCARCHDHKFDPIPQKDYYSMQSMFMAAEKTRSSFNTTLPGGYDLGENMRHAKLRKWEINSKRC